MPAVAQDECARVESRDQENLRAGPIPVQPPRQFDSRHIGHFDGCHEYVNRSIELVGFLKRLFAATGGDERIAGGAERDRSRLSKAFAFRKEDSLCGVSRSEEHTSEL